MAQDKLSIGAVEFAEYRHGRLYNLHLMGRPRVEALRLFYLQKHMEVGLVPVARNPHREITHEDVYWDSAGEDVTGREPEAPIKGAVMNDQIPGWHDRLEEARKKVPPDDVKGLVRRGEK